jgi:hypothetical protein
VLLLCIIPGGRSIESETSSTIIIKVNSLEFSTDRTILSILAGEVLSASISMGPHHYWPSISTALNHHIYTYGKVILVLIDI